MQEKNQSDLSDQSLRPSLRPSFREAYRRAYKQTEAHCYTGDEAEIAKDICAIIAEIYMMSPERPIRVSGEWLDGYVVTEVFKEITSEHVDHVIRDFKNVSTSITNKKAYLRAMLYNSVFTLRSGDILDLEQI